MAWCLTNRATELGQRYSFSVIYCGIDIKITSEIRKGSWQEFNEKHKHAICEVPPFDFIPFDIYLHSDVYASPENGLATRLTLKNKLNVLSGAAGGRRSLLPPSSWKVYGIFCANV